MTLRRRRELTKLAADQYDGALSHFEPGPIQRKLLGELLARCRQESIEAALVLMPEGTSFERLYGPQTEPALQTLLAELRREHGVTSVSYALAARRRSHDLFSDGHHLFARSARELASPKRFSAEALPIRIVSRRTRSGGDASRDTILVALLRSRRRADSLAPQASHHGGTENTEIVEVGHFNSGVGVWNVACTPHLSLSTLRVLRVSVVQCFQKRSNPDCTTAS